MSELTKEQIDKSFGLIFQTYRQKNNLTQEKLCKMLSKSPKSISQIETAKDGTSKKTDIELMNLLEITPNKLYQNFITNPTLKQKIELSKKIENLPAEKIEAVLKIIDVLKDL